MVVKYSVGVNSQITQLCRCFRAPISPAPAEPNVYRYGNFTNRAPEERNICRGIFGAYISYQLHSAPPELRIFKRLRSINIPSLQDGMKERKLANESVKRKNLSAIYAMKPIGSDFALIDVSFQSA